MVAERCTGTDSLNEKKVHIAIHVTLLIVE